MSDSQTTSTGSLRCTEPGRPGDRRVGQALHRKAYGSSCAERCPGGGLVLLRLASGQLAAFSVQGPVQPLLAAGGTGTPGPLRFEGRGVGTPALFREPGGGRWL